MKPLPFPVGRPLLARDFDEVRQLPRDRVGRAFVQCAVEEQRSRRLLNRAADQIRLRTEHLQLQHEIGRFRRRRFLGGLHRCRHDQLQLRHLGELQLQLFDDPLRELRFLAANNDHLQDLG